MVQKGIKRLYVIGRYEEKDFVYNVIRAMTNIRELKLISTFPLFRDYRGEDNGVGAMLAVNEVLRRLNLTLRPVGVSQSDLSLTVPVISPEPVDTVDVINEDDNRALAEIAERIIIQLSDYPKEWISLAQFGLELRKQSPSFTPKQYGGRNLLSVLKKVSTLEFEERNPGSDKADYVRLITVNENAVKAITMATDDAGLKARIIGIIKANTPDNIWLFLGILGKKLNMRFLAVALNTKPPGEVWRFCFIRG